MKKLRIGVFGCSRGAAHMRSIAALEGAEVVAICDRVPEKVQSALEFCPRDVKICGDYGTLLDAGLDAVVLANDFHEHAPRAIEAMERGIDVLSECTAAGTMQECADLCRAVERTGRTYALLENCPYMLGPLEMRRVYQSGILGKAIYGEGEYVHPGSGEFISQVMPTPDHWRRFLPVTYYLTHSAGPILYVTDAVPVRVIGKTAPHVRYGKKSGKHVYDGTGVMLCEMSDGSLFRFCGCSNYAPHEYWYRVACEYGCCETVRGDESSVRVAFNPWEKPDGWETEQVYKRDPLSPEELERAAAQDHGGIDFRMMKDVLGDLHAGRQPYFDVYRSCAMSATAILGWRSVLNDSKQYEIPDFRSEESRKICDGDTATPFPGGKEPPIRCSWAMPENG